MIHATKAEVDEAKRSLADQLDGLALAINRWQRSPNDRTKLSDARHSLDKAESAFTEYEQVLKTWAAGPAGDRQPTIQPGQEPTQ